MQTPLRQPVSLNEHINKEKDTYISKTKCSEIDTYYDIQKCLCILYIHTYVCVYIYVCVHITRGLFFSVGVGVHSEQAPTRLKTVGVPQQLLIAQVPTIKHHKASIKG